MKTRVLIHEHSFATRHPVWTAILWLMLFPLGLFQIGMYGAHGFWAGTLWLFLQMIPVMAILWGRHRARQHSRMAEIAARADYEHNAILNGDVARGFYGQYQPPSIN